MHTLTVGRSVAVRLSESAYDFRHRCSGGAEVIACYAGAVVPGRAALSTLGLLAVLGVAPAGAGPLRIGTLDPGGFAQSVAQTPDGYLWVGTKLGLVRFDGERFVALAVPEGMSPLRRVRALRVGRDGALWIGLQDGRLFQRSDGVLSLMAEQVGPPGAAILGLCFDRTGELWARTTKTLSRLAPGGWRHVPLTAVPPETDLRVWARSDGSVWTETTDGWTGVLGEKVTKRLTPTATERLDAFVDIMLEGRTVDAASRAAVAESVPRAALVDRRGRLWVAARGGLWLQERERLRALGTADGLPESSVRLVQEDAEGNIWALTNGGSLVRISTAAIYGLTKADGLVGTTPFAVAEDAQGTVWIATSGGLSAWREGRFTSYPKRDLGFETMALTIGGDGTLWIVSVGGRLFAWKEGHATPVPLPLAGDQREDVTALVAAGDEVLVGGTTGALYRKEAAGFVRVEAGLPRCRVEAPFQHPCPEGLNVITPRRAGGFWIGTYGGGLYAWRPGAPATRVAPLPSTLRIFDVVDGDGGVVWVAGESGLWRIDPSGRVRRFGVADGLPDENLYAILDDGAGRFFVGSEAGILRLSKRALEARAQDGKAPLEVAQYRRSDGIPSDETLGTWDRPALRARVGVLMFTMTSGLAVIDPALALPGPPLAVHVEEFLHDGMPVAVGPSLRLPAGRGDLAVRFAAPAFAAPQQVRFRYRLDGIDGDWRDGEDRRSIAYSHVPAGKYTLRIGAATADGARAPGEAVLQFELAPHVWQTAWFRALGVTLAGSLIVLLGLARAARSRARFALILEERQRIARDLHDSLAQVFTALSLQLDAVARQLPAAEGLARLRQTVVEGRRATRAAIWNLRADAHPDGLERALRELIAPGEDVELRVATEGAPYALELAAENDLLMIAQQAVSNALEHGRARHVGIELEYAPDRLALWIRDDGQGFEPAAEPRQGHYGLPGMRERAARAGGSLVVESSPGDGTEIGVVIDRPRRRQR